jgi:hypothetical protein
MDVIIKVSDHTTPDILDSHFEHAWKMKSPVRFIIDLRQCNTISLHRILSIKSVLDHHRPNSKRYIEHSTVIVKSRLTRRLLQIGLSIIRTERPVFIRIGH